MPARPMLLFCPEKCFGTCKAVGNPNSSVGRIHRLPMSDGYFDTIAGAPLLRAPIDCLGTFGKARLVQLIIGLSTTFTFRASSRFVKLPPIEIGETDLERSSFDF